MAAQLHIPKPCNENWDAMTPSEQGRFCNSCAKVVVDFTSMTHEEILAYLEQQQGETCGVFRKEQLSSPKTLSDKLKKFLYAFALVFLPFVSIQSSGQNIGLRQKITFVNKSQIKGQLLDQKQRPLQSIKISLLVETLSGVLHQLTQFSDLEGKYQFDSIQAGTHYLSFEGSSYVTNHAQIIDYRSRKTKNISDNFRVAKSKLLAPLLVEAPDPNTFNTRGNYHLGGIAIIAPADANDVVPHIDPENLEDPILTGLDNFNCVDKVPDNNMAKYPGEITGTLTGSKGKPLGLTMISVLQNGILIRKTITDSNGGYKIKPLPPGTYQLEVKMQAYRTKLKAPVVVRSGRSTILKLEHTIRKDGKDMVIKEKPVPPGDLHGLCLVAGQVAVPAPSFFAFPNWIRRMKKELMWDDE